MMVAELGPRAPVPVMCPYCRHANTALCRRPASYEVLMHCRACLGSFVVRFEVTIKALALTIAGEADRVADEQQERLEFERARGQGPR